MTWKCGNPEKSVDYWAQIWNPDPKLLYDPDSKNRAPLAKAWNNSALCRNLVVLGQNYHSSGFLARRVSLFRYRFFGSELTWRDPQHIAFCMHADWPEASFKGALTWKIIFCISPQFDIGEQDRTDKTARLDWKMLQISLAIKNLNVPPTPLPQNLGQGRAGNLNWFSAKNCRARLEYFQRCFLPRRFFLERKSASLLEILA